ncbi:hypothetical protein HanRHA438_Chr14g0676821 [Helianthus annuus]|nr:hypothetical protein HanRHA438_Chr14g0676821 [Helianthus annuus]
MEVVVMVIADKGRERSRLRANVMGRHVRAVCSIAPHSAGEHRNARRYGPKKKIRRDMDSGVMWTKVENGEQIPFFLLLPRAAMSFTPFFFFFSKRPGGRCNRRHTGAMFFFAPHYMWPYNLLCGMVMIFP